MKITIEVEDSDVLDIIRDVLELLAADETKEEKRKKALDLCKAFKKAYPESKTATNNPFQLLK